MDSESERMFVREELTTEIGAGEVRTEHLGIDAFGAEGTLGKDHTVVEIVLFWDQERRMSWST